MQSLSSRLGVSQEWCQHFFENIIPWNRVQSTNILVIKTIPRNDNFSKTLFSPPRFSEIKAIPRNRFQSTNIFRNKSDSAESVSVHQDFQK